MFSARSSTRFWSSVASRFTGTSMSAMGSVSRFIMTHVAIHPPLLTVELAAPVRNVLPAAGSAMSIRLAGETSLHFQIFGRGFPAIVHQLEVDALAFVER